MNVLTQAAHAARATFVSTGDYTVGLAGDATAIRAVAPFVLLHLFIWLANLFEPVMPGVSITTVTLTGHRALRVYRRDQPVADTTVVFIHGSPATGRAFYRQFADDFLDANLLAYDRPGYGGSAGLQALDLESQTAALAALLDALGRTNCILVGHSYGGSIALNLALQRPGLARGVVLVGGSVDPAQEKPLWIQQVGRWPFIRPLLPRAVDSCNLELLALRADLEMLRPQLARLEVPVVMLHGEKDGLVPLANVDYLESELRGHGRAHLFAKILLPDGSHFIPWKQPKSLRRAVARLARRERLADVEVALPPERSSHSVHDTDTTPPAL